MWIADNWKDYAVLDCGGGEKIERWGSQILQRPDPQAIWARDKDCKAWNRPNAIYHRSNAGGGKWEIRRLPEQWAIHYGDLTFQLKPMSFKHTGLFPEQAANWDFIDRMIRGAGRPISVLNLFAYTGGATLAAANAGASVCHVDASKGMVQWARENAASSGLADRPIRWIVDDCKKFVQREIRRGCEIRNYGRAGRAVALLAGLCPDDHPRGQAQRREPRRVENPLGRGLPLRKGAGKGRHRDAAATASWVCSLKIS